MIFKAFDFFFGLKDVNLVFEFRLIISYFVDLLPSLFIENSHLVCT